MSENKQQSDGGSGFDRDQMNALLGGGLSDRLLRQTPAAEAALGSKGNAHADKQKDVADMTIQETAAYLRQQQKQPTASSLAAQPRHRTANTSGKVRQYHQLLSEQQQQQETVVAAPSSSVVAPAVADRRYDSEDGEASGDDTKAQEFVRAPRAKAAPKVVTAKGTAASATAATAPLARKRRYDDSDNSSEESDQQQQRTTRQRRRRADSSSSSDGDSDNNASRRQRLLQQRKRNNEIGTTVQPVPTSKEATDEKKPHPPPKDGDNEINNQNNRRRDDDTSESDAAPPQPPPSKVVAHDRVPKEPVVVKVKRGDEESGSGSSSSEEESSGSSGSGSSSDDDNDDMTPIAKPLFVPKHKRGSVQQAADSTAAATAAEEKLAQATERRQFESRALVQQVVTAEATKHETDYDTALEGITGARNAMPDDNDDDDDAIHNNADDNDTAQDVWEVRELSRLLADWDLEVARRDDEQELARRRALTDDQKLREDTASGRYQRPGSKRDEDASNAGGRYYHKGAFYMDESEWKGESDVRHKATEYAKAATGSDKQDRRKLPAAMRVKNFGMANQSKYKGMAAEDTTDKQINVLPLLQPKGGSKRN